MPSNHPSFKLGIIGHNISYTLSPQIHEQWLKDFGLPLHYKTLDISTDQLASQVAVFKQVNGVGFNVTIPFKESIIPLLDRLEGDANSCQAVNVVKRENQKLIGFNTDGEGFLKSLETELTLVNPDWNIVILGYGGAAKAVFISLIEHQYHHFTISGRNQEKFEALKLLSGNNSHSPTFIDLVSLNGHLNSMDTQTLKQTLLINTLPCNIPLKVPEGMGAIYDLRYKYPKTPLSLNTHAQDKNIPFCNGLSMLVHQAAISFEIWFNHRVNEMQITKTIENLK